MANIHKLFLANSGNCQTIVCYWNNLILPLLYVAQGKGILTYSGKRTGKKNICSVSYYRIYVRKNQ